MSGCQISIRPQASQCKEAKRKSGKADRELRPPLGSLEPTNSRTPIMTSITPFLWFDNNVPQAVAFYKSVFPNAKVENVNDFMATFELAGQRFHALNGGPK